MLVRKIPFSNSTKNNIKLHINLTKDESFHCTPRRLPFAHKAQLRKILDDLLQRGESSSQYASPIVLTEKKNGDCRLWVDYNTKQNNT